MSTEGPEELSSWKEIADRLHVTVRTAQDWEKKRGLPVRRVPGGRGRVYLRISELEAWLDGQLEDEEPDSPREPGVDRRTHVDRRRGNDRRYAAVAARRRRVLAGMAIGALAIAALLWWWVLPGKPPVLAEVTTDQLIVRDEDGTELWRAAFAEEGLREEAYQSPEREPLIVDVNGDGHVEVLFIVVPVDITLPHSLVCYAEDGSELWRFHPGRAVKTATNSFEDIYQIAALRVAELEPGRRGIVVSSIYYFDHPTQLAVLSPDSGEIISEYWHSGHIGTFFDTLYLFDANKDGRLEIYAGGISNGHKQATLVVLDPFEMAGASVEEDPEYQIEGLAPERHIARVLFPRSSLNYAVENFYNGVGRVGVTDEGITVETRENLAGGYNPTVIRRLNFDFTLDELSPSDLFSARHQSLYAEGQIDTPLDDEISALSELQYVGPVQSLIPERQADRRRADGSGQAP